MSRQGGREQSSSYRDREVHSRPSIDRSRESRVPSSNTSYRSESYDQNRSQRPQASRAPSNNAPRGIIRSSQQKRSPEGFSDRGQRDSSPKRVKLNSRNLHEVRTIDNLSDSVNEKKVRPIKVYQELSIISYHRSFAGLRTRGSGYERVSQKTRRAKEIERKISSRERKSSKNSSDGQTVRER